MYVFLIINLIDSFLKGCIIETGVYIGAGNNVGFGGTVVENGQNDCASLCALTEKCVAWTFHISTSSCWLKSDESIKANADGWITGTKECGNRGMCE